MGVCARTCQKKKETLDKLDTNPLFSLAIKPKQERIRGKIIVRSKPKYKPLITLEYQLSCRSSLKPNRARFLFSFLHPWACRHVRKEASGLTVFGPRPAAVSVSVWVFGRMGVWVYSLYGPTHQFPLLPSENQCPLWFLYKAHRPSLGETPSIIPPS